MNTNQNNIFFYRDRDPASIQIYTLLKSNNLLNYFKLIDVDKTRVPVNIQRIPALLIPQIKRILYDNEIFNFIHNISSNKRTNNMNNHNNYIEDYQNHKVIDMNKYNQNTPNINQNTTNINHNQNTNINKSNIQQYIQSNIQSNNQKKYNEQKNILGFIECEMSGFSDNYTFSDSNINIAPQHNFVKSDDVIKIFTVNDNTKLSINETKNRISKLTDERNKDNEMFKMKNTESRNNKLYNEQIKKINEKLNEIVKKKEQQL